ncbi:hypothetical protein F5887DRAFT_290892 [Amanita rubescens]|nr:hypothetical protein F5887DRAFT_290892 [Amanita rubescens]
MLLLHTLLFFLFGTQASVVAGHPLLFPRDPSPPSVTLHIPKESYGPWYRRVRPKRGKSPIPDEHINDVIVLGSNPSVMLHQLPPANNLQVPKKVGPLEANQFSRLEDDWIFYPHVGDSQEFRHEVISIRFDKAQNKYIVSEPRVLKMEPFDLRESTMRSTLKGFIGSDGPWYLISGPAGITEKVMQLQETGNHRTISLLPLPGPIQKNYERKGSVSVEEVKGLYRRYPTSDTPRQIRDQMLEVSTSENRAQFTLHDSPSG